jgi:hypothetical protein
MRSRPRSEHGNKVANSAWRRPSRAERQRESEAGDQKRSPIQAGSSFRTCDRASNRSLRSFDQCQRERLRLGIASECPQTPTTCCFPTAGAFDTPEQPNRSAHQPADAWIGRSAFVGGIRDPQQHRTTVTMTDHISADVLASEVAGPGINAQPLKDLLAGGPTLLVFLRHFG